MNKKLLVAAIGATLAAAPMLAANAAVTVYGKINIGVASLNNGNSTDNKVHGCDRRLLAPWRQGRREPRSWSEGNIVAILNKFSILTS